MKKIVSLALVVVMLVCVLASCGNISESYAKKINEAAANKEHYTYSQVIEDLGGKEKVADLTITVLGSTSGTVIAVKGCSNWDEIEDKIDEGETVKGRRRARTHPHLLRLLRHGLLHLQGLL